MPITPSKHKEIQAEVRELMHLANYQKKFEEFLELYEGYDLKEVEDRMRLATSLSELFLKTIHTTVDTAIEAMEKDIRNKLSTDKTQA